MICSSLNRLFLTTPPLAQGRENRQLKHIVAEQAVDIRGLKAVLAKK